MKELKNVEFMSKPSHESAKKMTGTVMPITRTTEIMTKMTPDRLQAIRALQQEPARGSK